MLQIPQLKVGDIVLQPLYRRLRVADNVIVLTEQESYLLEALVLCANSLVSHRMLNAVSQLRYRRMAPMRRVDSNTVISHIYRLRKKLQTSQRVRICPVYKEGYKLVVA